MTPTHTLRGLMVGLAILGLTGCTAAPAEPTPEPSTTTIVAAEPIVTPSPGSAVEVDPADAPERLQFSVLTLDGATFEGSSLYGTPTVLWFWAPWCPICQADAPAIADAFDEMPEGVQLIGVPGRSDEESMRAFVEEYGLQDMVQIVDPDGFLWSNFSVASQPAITLIDAEGGIRTLPGTIGKAGLLEAARSIA